MSLQRCFLFGAALVGAGARRLLVFGEPEETPTGGPPEEYWDEESTSSFPTGMQADAVLQASESIVAGDANEELEVVDDSAATPGREKLELVEVGDTGHIKKNVTVAITWVRHGLSCANINKRFNKPGKTNESGWGMLRAATAAKNWINGQGVNWFSMTDPILSNCGRTRTARLAARLAGIHFDLVAASGLLRAQETAAIQFGGKRVYVLPFVSESPSIGQCNQRITTKEQLAYTKSLGYKIDYMFWKHAKNVNDAWKLYDQTMAALQMGRAGSEFVPYDIKPPSSRRLGKPHKPDAKQALAFLGSTVLPTLLKKAEASQSIFRLGVVSHGQFMKFNLDCNHVWSTVPKRKEPWNNEALTILYTYDGYSLKEVPGSCVLESLGEAPLASICPEEFARCPAALMSSVVTGECGCDDSERQLALRTMA